ncbi:hypothetical protein JCM5350_003025 [Sporobolomyces pararoseus]
MYTDSRPLPPGWITEIDPATGVPYYVDTTAASPQAVWEDPRDAYYNSLATSIQYSAPPPPSINSSAYPSQSNPPAYTSNQTPNNPQQYGGIPSGSGYNPQYSQNSPPSQSTSNDQDKGLMSSLMGGKRPQGYNQQQQTSSSPFGGSSLMSGAGGAVAGAVAYKLFESVTGKNKKHHSNQHFSPGYGGGGAGGLLGGLMGGGHNQGYHSGGGMMGGMGGMGMSPFGGGGGIFGGGGNSMMMGHHGGHHSHHGHHGGGHHGHHGHRGHH